MNRWLTYCLPFVTLTTSHVFALNHLRGDCDCSSCAISSVIATSAVCIWGSRQVEKCGIVLCINVYAPHMCIVAWSSARGGVPQPQTPLRVEPHHDRWHSLGWLPSAVHCNQHVYCCPLEWQSHLTVIHVSIYWQVQLGEGWFWVP